MRKLSRADKLQELVDKAEGPEELPEERKEMEELKALLPEIQEKVEDAIESQKTASTAKSVSQECKCLHEEARLTISTLHNTAGGSVER